jgi:protein SCO1/2
MVSKKSVIKYSVVFGLLAVPSVLFYVFVYTGVHHVSRLKFYGPKKIVEKSYRGKMIKDTLYHEVGIYTAPAHNKKDFNSSTFDGQIYIAHFIDAKEIKNIPKEIVYAFSEALPEHPDIKALTHIIHGENMDWSRPSSFTKKLAPVDSLWTYLFLNDSSAFIRDFYFPENEKTDRYSIVLIDKEKRIRGYYNPILAADIKRLKQEISYLKREYELNFKTHRYFKYDDKIEQKRN